MTEEESLRQFHRAYPLCHLWPVEVKLDAIMRWHEMQASVLVADLLEDQQPVDERAREEDADE